MEIPLGCYMTTLACLFFRHIPTLRRPFLTTVASHLVAKQYLCFTHKDEICVTFFSNEIHLLASLPRVFSHFEDLPRHFLSFLFGWPTSTPDLLRLSLLFSQPRAI